MTCRILNVSSLQDWMDSSQWLKQRNRPNPEIEKNVAEIIKAVEERGDDALLEYTRKFDCKDFEPPFRISQKEIARAAASVSSESRSYISDAAQNIRTFHEAQLDKSWFITRADGSILGQRVTPVDSAGLYVPGGQGGKTPLISSLLMNAIPAQVAGCPRLALITPPMENGEVNPYLLAAAHLLDIDEVYKLGSAWGIAALALGTKTIPSVDVIAGPGNIYVTTAKRLIHGLVGIDMLAGPSEVLIIADSAAQPEYVAADMLSQAEHDGMASAICLTTDRRMADSIYAELNRQLVSLPRADIAGRALNDWSCICVCSNIRVAVEVANFAAPEHLELSVRDPWSILPFIRHAGAVFMGQNSPEAVGDYFAGPNHVLPTLGTARFSSALSTQTFCKKTSIIAASKAFLYENKDAVAELARLEGLEAHARSVEIRNRIKSSFPQDGNY